VGVQTGRSMEQEEEEEEGEEEGEEDRIEDGGLCHVWEFG